MSNRHNTYEKNISVIVTTYFLSGINLIVAGSISSTTLGERYRFELILIGVMMLVMVLISLIDKRKEMRGRLQVIGGYILHFVICCLLSFIHSFWWLVVYVFQILLCFFARIILKHSCK